MHRGTGIVAIVVAAAVFVGAVVVHQASAAPPRRQRARGPATSLIGQVPPDVNATRVVGSDPVSLGDLRGRVVIVDFWATWCGPCTATMPLLDRMHVQNHARGLTVLGLTEEPRPTVEDHLRRLPVRYTVAQDVGRTTARYGVSALPTLVVIDRAGKVREVIVGMPEAQRLSALVDQLLREPTP